MEEETKHTSPFDMEEMRMNLLGRLIGGIQENFPVKEKRTGLSMYYTGKSRTFECISDVQCLDDLKKREHPIIKGRKKQLDEIRQQHMSSPCRPPSDTNLRASPIIGL